MQVSIRAFDRAQDAYNLAKKAAVQQKTIVFIMTRPKAGVFPYEIRFPYPGKVVEVYISSGKPGATDTQVQIETCSQADYDTAPVWNAILASPLVLDANEKSTRTSSSPTSISNDVVNKDDHFRVNFLSVGTGLDSVSLEVVVEI